MTEYYEPLLPSNDNYKKIFEVKKTPELDDLSHKWSVELFEDLQKAMSDKNIFNYSINTVTKELFKKPNLFGDKAKKDPDFLLENIRAKAGNWVDRNGNIQPKVEKPKHNSFVIPTDRVERIKDSYLYRIEGIDKPLLLSGVEKISYIMVKEMANKYKVIISFGG